MQPIKRIASLLALFSFTSINCQETIAQATVLVCYGDVNPDKIRGYKYVILESEHYNPFDVKLLQENNELVLGYISMGEVSPSRFYFESIREKTVGKNPIWDSYYLDLEDSTTQAAIGGFVDKIKGKGFDGVFLDTVDVYGPWGPQAKQEAAYAKLIKFIKEKYPDFHLMQNAGLEIVPRVKNEINSIAIESVITNYNFNRDQYKMRKSRETQEKAIELSTINERYGLPIILIEYADSRSMFNKVKTQAINLKWDYFIGNIGLESLPKFK